jgi:hypothetical protein
VPSVHCSAAKRRQLATIATAYAADSASGNERSAGRLPRAGDRHGIVGGTCSRCRDPCVHSRGHTVIARMKGAAFIAAVVVASIASSRLASAQDPQPAANDEAAASPAPAEQAKHRPTFIAANFSQVAAFVGRATRRQLVVAPEVCAVVTAGWHEPLTDTQLYREFLAIVAALGFEVTEEGTVTRITAGDSPRRNSQRPCRRFPAN